MHETLLTNHSRFDLNYLSHKLFIFILPRTKQETRARVSCHSGWLGWLLIVRPAATGVVFVWVASQQQQQQQELKGLCEVKQYNPFPFVLVVKRVTEHGTSSRSNVFNSKALHNNLDASKSIHNHDNL